MKQAGIDVDVGLLEEKNKKLNECYLKYITKKIPFVLAKAAAGLDGKIATKTHASRWISSKSSREYTHLLRGEFDAVMVGINTILKDDPLLTVRHPNWKGKHLIRIITDSKLQFPLNSRILKTLSQGEIFVFTQNNTSKRKSESLKEKGVEIFFQKEPKRKIDLRWVLQTLGNRSISSVLVEGGGRLITSMLEDKLLDKMLLVMAPKLIGGEKAPSFFRGEGVEQIAESLHLEKTAVFRIDEDIFLEGYL